MKQQSINEVHELLGYINGRLNGCPNIVKEHSGAYVMSYIDNCPGALTIEFLPKSKEVLGAIYHIIETGKFDILGSCTLSMEVYPCTDRKRLETIGETWYLEITLDIPHERYFDGDSKFMLLCQLDAYRQVFKYFIEGLDQAIYPNYKEILESELLRKGESNALTIGLEGDKKRELTPPFEDYKDYGVFNSVRDYHYLTPRLALKDDLQDIGTAVFENIIKEEMASKIDFKVDVKENFESAKISFETENDADRVQIQSLLATIFTELNKNSESWVELNSRCYEAGFWEDSINLISFWSDADNASGLYDAYAYYETFKKIFYRCLSVFKKEENRIEDLPF